MKNFLRIETNRIQIIATIAIAAIAGFFVRAAFVIGGYNSFNSDEVLYYRLFSEFSTKTNLSDYIYQLHFLPGIRLLFFYVFYFLSGNRLNFLPFFACLTNVLFYLLWMYVLRRRTGSYWSGVPLALFLMSPSPAISYLSTNLSEIRMSFFYGAIFVLFAGKWFGNPRSFLLFGLIASLACWEDLMSVFFILPVVFYEVSNKPSKTWSFWIRGLFLTVAGSSWIFLVHPENSAWTFFSKTSYLHLGLGSFHDWVDHAGLLVEAWPIYWCGGLPWGYLQNSQLGRFLNTGLTSRFWMFAPYFFWFLITVVIFGSFRFFSFENRFKEIWLWWGPAFLFVLFFIFGGQTWDSLTLRYLSFWQLVPAILLGLWAVSLRGSFKKKVFFIVLVCWVLFNALFLAVSLCQETKESPAQRIAAYLEGESYKAGFANYWVSEPVCYFSNNRVLLAPYNHMPISREATMAAQNSKKIVLVWLEGLDRPETFEKVVDQIKTMGYRPVKKKYFQDEGWFVMFWDKL